MIGGNVEGSEWYEQQIQTILVHVKSVLKFEKGLIMVALVDFDMPILYVEWIIN